MRKSLFLILPLAAGVDVSCAPFVVNGSPDYDTCKFTACPGQVISASLCYADSKCEGDTYLTLHNDNYTRVELNDDFCGVCSALSYSVPHSVECGVFELRQGCFSSFCSGVTAVSVADRPQHGWEPWFYANPLDHRGAVLTAWFVEVAIWGFLSSVQFILHKNEYPSAVRKVGVFKAILIFSLWFLLEFSILSARFNYYLQHENGHKYEPYRLGSGDLVFLSKEFFRATPRDLEDAGCGYEDIVGAHEHSGNYVCSFIYPLGPELISQGYVQFSIGAQLILIVFLQFTCLIFKIILLDQNSDGTVASNALSCLTGAGLEFVLNLHQYMILLPLTAVLPNEFCARVLVPVSTQKAICLFKIAAAMIPYGMPSVLGGIFILYLAYSVGKSASKSNNVFLYLICIVVGTTGLYFFATGLCMVIFWLFGCVVLGMWYALEGVSLSFATAETALILNAMKCTPFLFSFFDVMLYPLPLKDENSFYHASYARLVWARKYAYTLYSSEPCCVDMCAWIWVRLSTLELFISEKIGSCWESILHWCCQRSKGAQVACEDIVFSES